MCLGSEGSAPRSVEYDCLHSCCSDMLNREYRTWQTSEGFIFCVQGRGCVVWTDLNAETSVVVSKGLVLSRALDDAT